MNAYYDNFNRQISDSRIIEGYFEEIQQRESLWKRLCKKAKAVLGSVLVKRLAKPVSLALSLAAVTLIVGAIEGGRMGLGAGLLAGGFVIALEALALRGIKSRS